MSQIQEVQSRVVGPVGRIAMFVGTMIVIWSAMEAAERMGLGWPGQAGAFVLSMMLVNTFAVQVFGGRVTEAWGRVEGSPDAAWAAKQLDAWFVQSKRGTIAARTFEEFVDGFLWRRAELLAVRGRQRAAEACVEAMDGAGDDGRLALEGWAAALEGRRPDVRSAADALAASDSPMKPFGLNVRATEFTARYLHASLGDLTALGVLEQEAEALAPSLRGKHLFALAHGHAAAGDDARATLYGDLLESEAPWFGADEGPGTLPPLPDLGRAPFHRSVVGRMLLWGCVGSLVGIGSLVVARLL